MNFRVLNSHTQLPTILRPQAHCSNPPPPPPPRPGVYFSLTPPPGAQQVVPRGNKGSSQTFCCQIFWANSFASPAALAPLDSPLRKIVIPAGTQRHTHSHSRQRWPRLLASALRSAPHVPPPAAQAAHEHGFRRGSPQEGGDEDSGR
eukprot:SAG31_NODE_2886_length_4952_cov_4.399135_5_plen_147_part_00